ncbi:MAG: hypothetical protein M1825_001588 [Sarcosagium campestre]|nr:MAG: hypothetical protein M1825_001588 [Sarcosagium campestre]
MNTILQDHFHRIETALDTLIDSISSYNPSLLAATSLIEADDGLNKGLEKLAAHQTNASQLQSLRETTLLLDANIVSVLSRLAETRAELVDAPADQTRGNTNAIPYQTLLSYAAHISKFTTIPAGLKPPPEVAEQANGTTPSAKQNEDVSGVLPAGQLREEESKWLDATANLPYVPWPAEDMIRRGALAQVQSMREAGVDPAGVKSLEDGQGEGTNGAVDNRENQQHAGGNSAEPVESKATVQAPESNLRKEERPAVFAGLDLYDPDDE